MRIRRRANALLSWVVLALSLWAAPALAQDAGERAREHYAKGLELYKAASYDQAISEFEAGLALDPNAMFHYSLSLCHGKLGRYEEAQSHAAQARAMGRMTPDVTTKNDSRIAAWQIQQRADTVGAEIQAADPLIARPLCSSDDQCSDRGLVCDAHTKLCVEKREKKYRRIGPIGWAGVVAVGAGAATLTAAGITSLSVGSKEKDLEDARTVGEADALIEDIDAQKSTGRAMLFTGATLAVAGATLFILDYFVIGEGDRSAQTAHFAPMLLPTGGGVSWTGRF